MSYAKELAFAKELAYKAGKIMRRYFRAEDIGTTWKEDKTPLTVADTKINDLVIERVKAEFPDHGVLGEEDSYELERDTIWVVDPIDGTAPFTLGIPVSTFSMALVNKSDGKPVIAVVYDPVLDHLYHAVKGAGAYLNGEPLGAMQDETLAQKFVFVAGGFKDGKKVYSPGKCADIIYDNYGAKPINVSSYIYFASKIASGELAGSIIGLKSTWDVATVYLLVTEAGGIATDIYGNDQRYDGQVNGMIAAANAQIHSLLKEAVKKAAP